MATITIRVTEEEKNFLKYMSDFMGQSVSTLIKNYTIEELEDMFDTNRADAAYKEWKDSNSETVSFEQAYEEMMGYPPVKRKG